MANVTENLTDEITTATNRESRIENSESRNEEYTLIVGGMVLVRDGRAISVIRPAAIYHDMSYANVQTVWHWSEENEEVQLALSQFNRAIAHELIALGDAFGIERGRMTVGDLTTIQEIVGAIND